MTQRAPRGLKRLARAYGVQLEYEDYNRRRQEADPHAVMMVLRALGAPVDTPESISEAARHHEAEHWQRTIDPVAVAWRGRTRLTVRLPESEARGPIRYEVYLEDGVVLDGRIPETERRVRRRLETDGRFHLELDVSLPDRLPFGYHDYAIETRRHRGHGMIISAPEAAFRPRDERGACERTWGVFLPVHALRRPGDFGIGDFTSLETLMTWSGELGARFVGTLPMLASFLGEQPHDPSPYSPVSRLFWNEAFIDVERAVRESEDVDATRILESCDRNGDPALVDYRAVMASKRRVLEQLARDFFANGGERTLSFRRFVAANPLVEDYARFRAVTERQRSGWPAWPLRLQEGWLAPSDYDPGNVRYHLFAQFLSAHQLGQLAERARSAGTRLYLDLPLGVHGAGYDVWRERDLFATGISVGAPPDAFFTRGQNWGFPPLHPVALAEQRFQYFIDSIRSHLRFAGALRLDHVMMLHRLFWIPNGLDARSGVYVRYPTDALYAILTLESARANAIIVGEDLGTVPPEVRRRMDRHAVSRMYVVQFEADAANPAPLPPIPACSVASLNTHDMPTWTAYAAGQDADLRRDLDLIDEDEVRRTHAERAELLIGIAEQLRRAGFDVKDPRNAEAMLTVLLEYLAASDAMLLLVNMEDLWSEIRPQNVPGTGAERPNWQRRAALSLEQICRDEKIRRILRLVDEKRKEPA